MRAVIDAFGEEARHFVFVGGCVLGLYARLEGAPLRATADVDCISTRSPWVLQEKLLAELCMRGVLRPDPEVQCRYRITGTEIDVDVLSPQGFNVGGVNPWFERASINAKLYDGGEGRTVLAVTPPYFLATKLVAFADRGPDAPSSKDAEDIVALAVEVADLVAQVDAAGLRGDIAGLWGHVLEKYVLTADDLPDLVDWHLDRREREHRARVIATLRALTTR
jgi:predicted nucleotidyltransferase